jgi:hypothetical protein
MIYPGPRSAGCCSSSLRVASPSSAKRVPLMSGASVIMRSSISLPLILAVARQVPTPSATALQTPKVGGVWVRTGSMPHRAGQAKRFHGPLCR